MSSRAVVLVTTRSFSTGQRDLLKELDDAGYDVVRGATDHDLAALADPLRSAVAWIAGTSPVTAEHLAAAPRLRLVARYGVGVDKVDLAAAAARGVLVTNTPGANAAAVADHTIALLLASLRGLLRADRAVRDGDWRAWRTRELGALTVGLLGFGRIGQATAVRLSAFGSTVLAADPAIDLHCAERLGVEPVAADALPERCDVVSLHAPGGTIIVDAAWLDRLDGPRWLINTARADLVDEEALIAALRTRPDLHYAADALLHEHGADVSSPLFAPDVADRVLITPHLAANTVEAVDQMGSIAVANTLAVLVGEPAPNLVQTRRP